MLLSQPRDLLAMARNGLLPESFFVAVHPRFRTFFFSSRRRHTRLTCDWRSDVCSSDLAAEAEIRQKRWRGPLHGVPLALKDLFDTAGRSEERRVGKECRCRWSAYR